MLLIVGSNGLLGRHVVNYFMATGESVICASHGPGADIRLDLRMPIGDVANIIPEHVTHALICSSVTNIDACYRDPEGTRRFNVTHTIDLLQVLLNRSIQPIFCSSDLVFKGDIGNYHEDDPRHPTTEYGRQKQTVEDFLLNQEKPFLIIRMSKLYSIFERDDPSPIGQMLNALRDETVIRCAEDQIICPTCVVDIPHAVNLLLRSKTTGVYHVAAPQQYTRFTLGMRLAKSIGLEHLVQGCSIRDFHFAEPRPFDNSLNVSRFLSATGFTFTTLEENLPRILGSREEFASSNVFP